MLQLLSVHCLSPLLNIKSDKQKKLCRNTEVRLVSCLFRVKNSYRKSYKISSGEFKGNVKHNSKHSALEIWEMWS